MKPVRDAAQHRADVHVIVRDQNRILMGQRLKAVFHGHWQLPSGRLDPGEPGTFGAARELWEEARLRVGPDELRFVHLIHHRSPYGTDRLGLVFEATSWQGEPVNAEPDACAGWEWFPLELLPQPVPPYLAQVFAHYRQGLPYSEYAWPSPQR